MLESDRIILRPWNESDAPALFKYASEPKVSELALWPCHTSMEMSKWVIENVFQPNVHSYAIVLKSTNEPIGCIGLVPPGEEHFVLNGNEREVGYWIGLPYWGKGLATEALYTLADYCSNKLRLDSLIITTDSTNMASQRVAEKCGFSLIGNYVFDGIQSKAFRKALNRIVRCHKDNYDMLANIWERSVRMTHDFITENDIREIKRALLSNYFPSVELYQLIVGNTTVGFIGLSEEKIEMLFIDSKHIRNGYGSELIDFALKKGISNVDVNEQNPQAVAFYRVKGFEITGRDETDETGRPYPILHLSIADR